MEARDILFMALLLFVVGITVFISFFLNKTFTTELRTVEAINNTPEAMTALDNTDKVLNHSDYIYFAVFVGFVLFIIISGWFIGGHPIFTIFYLIFIVASVIVGAVLSNTWETVVSDPAFGTTLTSFPITNHIMTNLPMYLAVMGFLAVIIVFAKPVTQAGAQE